MLNPVTFTSCDTGEPRLLLAYRTSKESIQLWISTTSEAIGCPDTFSRFHMISYGFMRFHMFSSLGIIAGFAESAAARSQFTRETCPKSNRTSSQISGAQGESNIPVLTEVAKCALVPTVEYPQRLGRSSEPIRHQVMENHGKTMGSLGKSLAEIPWGHYEAEAWAW